MRIFITGGTGFIGKPVTDFLAAANHKLLILSRQPPKSKLINTRLIKGDLGNLDRLKNKIKVFRPEAIIHLAWEGIPDYSAEQSFKNLKYSLDLLEFAVQTGVKKFIGAGTCWEYGLVTGRLREDFQNQPLNIFALAKDCFRKLAFEICSDKNMSFMWLRLFYVYGPGQKSSSLIPYIINSLNNGSVPEIKNPGVQNDFVYIEDVARAFVLAISNAKKSAIYNVGSGKLTAVGEIVNMLYPAYIVRSKRKTPGFFADISKINKEIGWQPKVNFKSGVKKTLNHFTKQR